VAVFDGSSTGAFAYVVAGGGAATTSSAGVESPITNALSDVLRIAV